MDHILPTNQVPYIGDYIKIICSLCNKFLPPLSANCESSEDFLCAERMMAKLKEENKLQKFVEDNNLHRRSISKWSSVNESVSNFPQLDETMLKLLTLGTYQLKLCPSYIQEYMGSECTIDVFRETCDLIRVRLQSRHISSKTYQVWIQYDSDHVKAWYCQCRAGARTVGTCSHVASVIWYLSGLSGPINDCGIQDWGKYIDDASHVPQTVDTSDSESDVSTVEE